MRDYKGYFIGEGCFKNEKEVDAFIKKESIRRVKVLNKALDRNESPAYQYKVMEDLHNYEMCLHYDYGMSWEEIEEIPYTA